ncbi:MAG: prolipoprotein diacylglyceryl transferase [Pirellulales bacterium]
MRQTLFTIPYTVTIPYTAYELPIFGAGLLIVLWGIVVAVSVYLAVRKQGWRAELWGMLPSLALVGAAILLLPRLFQDGLPIRGYGVMVLLGVLAGVGLAVHRARQVGLDPEILLSLVLWLLIPGVVGARMFHVVEYWHTDYHRETWIETFQRVLNVPQGGLVVYGALFGACIGFLVFTYRRHLRVLAMADLIAPSLAIGLALGRIGCFLNGCCYGGPTDLPWAVRFPAGSPPYESQLQRGDLLGFNLVADETGRPRIGRIRAGTAAEKRGLTKNEPLHAVNGVPVQSVVDAERWLGASLGRGDRVILTLANGHKVELPAVDSSRGSLPVHPTQLYSSITAALLCFFLWSYYPFRRHDGEVTALMLTLYPILRLLLEIIRTDERAVFHTGLSISQNVSLLLLLGIVGLWVYVLSRPPLSPVQAGEPPSSQPQVMA